MSSKYEDMEAEYFQEEVKRNIDWIKDQYDLYDFDEINIKWVLENFSKNDLLKLNAEINKMLLRERALLKEV